MPWWLATPLPSPRLITSASDTGEMTKGLISVRSAIGATTSKEPARSATGEMMSRELASATGVMMSREPGEEDAYLLTTLPWRRPDGRM